MRRALQVILVVLGSVALIAGGAQVLFGTQIIPDPGDFGASVDSEMRFFATWFALIGVLLLNAARAPESHVGIIRATSVAVFVGGCARALSWATVGAPDARFIVLMVIELVIPFVVIPLQMAVERGTPRR